MNIGKDDLGGVRKLLQDFLAPELGSIKATLASHSEQLALIRQEAREQKQDILRVIEANSAEIKALIRASDAERQAASALQRVAELERELAAKREQPSA